MQGTLFAEADFLKYFTARTAFGGKLVITLLLLSAYNPY